MNLNLHLTWMYLTGKELMKNKNNQIIIPDPRSKQEYEELIQSHTALISEVVELLEVNPGVISGVGSRADPEVSLVNFNKQRMNPDHILLSSMNNKVQDLIKTSKKIAKSRAPILLTGETGTGKEVLARFIHLNSYRAKGPFIVINCATIPENLLESELFGYRKGAFTGANQDKEGLLAQGNGGTVLLDEIGELSLSLQAKLLRFLQEHSILPLGGIKQIELDVRMLVATNQDLEKAIKINEFRKDLFYRLNVFNLKIPPLKKRLEDIPLLAEHLSLKYCQQNNTAQKSFSSNALKMLKSYSWPGNIRELENIIHQAVVMSDESQITQKILFPIMKNLLGKIPEIQPVIDMTGVNIKKTELHEKIHLALSLPKGKRGQERRLGSTIPVSELIGFFESWGDAPFPPRSFADHISQNSRNGRRDRLANGILRTFVQNNIIIHNNQKAQKVRYQLNSEFIERADT